MDPFVIFSEKQIKDVRLDVFVVTNSRIYSGICSRSFLSKSASKSFIPVTNLFMFSALLAACYEINFAPKGFGFGQALSRTT